jgi:hypothetical protein
MKLRNNLGQWLRQDIDIWQWYYSQTLDSLVQIVEPTEIKLYSRQIAYSNGIGSRLMENGSLNYLLLF